MESKGLKQHTIDSVISSIDSWYKKEAENYLNKVNFGIKNDEETDIKKYRFLKAFDNIICRNMTCDLKVTNELLEAVSVYTKTSTFKDLSIDYTLKKKEGKKPFNEIRSSKSGNNDNTPPFTKVLIYINEELKYEQFCGLDLKFALVNSLTNTVTPTYDGTDIIIQDTRVSNSDDSYDVNLPSGVDLELPDENITLNGGAFITKPSVKDQNIELVDLFNAPIIPDSVVANKISVDTNCADARVSNSDDSYDVNVASGGDLELPDEDITLNGGAFITKPSVKNQDIELVDTGDAPITPNSVVGNKIVVDTSAGCVARGAIPLPTGANVSYATGDDGDLKRGRLVDYSTLPYNNGFGTTDRFTDELGGQIYTNNIIIDWSTWDGGTDVLGFIFTFRSDSHNTTKSWSDWMSGQPFTTNGFGNWYVVNPNEVLQLYDITTTNGLTNSPINIPTTSTGIFWTSYSPDGSSAWYSNRNTQFFRSTTITQPYNSMFVRTFNWDGASLT